MFRSLSRRQQPPLHGLLVCPQCGTNALCPTEWETDGPDHWRMWIRCGQCEAWLEAIASNRDAAALDIELDRQQRQIAAAADALDAERMAREVEAFSRALRLDLVDAGDFRSG